MLQIQDQKILEVIDQTLIKAIEEIHLGLTLLTEVTILDQKPTLEVTRLNQEHILVTEVIQLNQKLILEIIVQDLIM